jgi:predicted nucleic acid-binding protein
MNILVDTNVLVSAVIRDRLPQKVIEEIVSRDEWFWIVSVEIEREYRDVLAPSQVQYSRSYSRKMASLR